MIDYVIIDAKWCEIMDPKALVYSGAFLKTGAPRCDILYGDKTDIRKAFRKKDGLAQTDKIVIFAPTFREKSNNGVRSVYAEEWTIDFERMVLNLEKRFGGNWHLCLRVHPQLVKTIAARFPLISDIRIIDISEEDVRAPRIGEMHRKLLRAGHVCDRELGCIWALLDAAHDGRSCLSVVL